MSEQTARDLGLPVTSAVAVGGLVAARIVYDRRRARARRSAESWALEAEGRAVVQ